MFQAFLFLLETDPVPPLARISTFLTTKKLTVILYTIRDLLEAQPRPSGCHQD